MYSFASGTILSAGTSSPSMPGTQPVSLNISLASFRKSHTLFRYCLAHGFTLEDRMQTAFYVKQGPAREVLQVGEQPTTEPGPGEVRVHLKTSGVNPSDWKSRSGRTA